MDRQPRQRPGTSALCTSMVKKLDNGLQNAQITVILQIDITCNGKHRFKPSGLNLHIKFYHHIHHVSSSLMYKSSYEDTYIITPLIDMFGDAFQRFFFICTTFSSQFLHKMTFKAW